MIDLYILLMQCVHEFVEKQQEQTGNLYKKKTIVRSRGLNLLTSGLLIS